MEFSTHRYKYRIEWFVPKGADGRWKGTYNIRFFGDAEMERWGRSFQNPERVYYKLVRLSDGEVLYQNDLFRLSLAEAARPVNYIKNP
jgi:hypothetical protein